MERRSSNTTTTTMMMMMMMMIIIIIIIIVVVVIIIMCMSFRTYRGEVNPFETDTKGRLFVVGASVNWPSNRNRRTKVLGSWKATRLNLLRRKSVNTRPSRRPAGNSEQ